MYVILTSKHCNVLYKIIIIVFCSCSYDLYFTITWRSACCINIFCLIALPSQPHTCSSFPPNPVSFLIPSVTLLPYPSPPLMLSFVCRLPLPHECLTLMPFQAKRDLLVEHHGHLCHAWGRQGWRPGCGRWRGPLAGWRAPRGDSGCPAPAKRHLLPGLYHLLPSGPGLVAALELFHHSQALLAVQAEQRVWPWPRGTTLRPQCECGGVAMTPVLSVTVRSSRDPWPVCVWGKPEHLLFSGFGLIILS